MNERSNSEKLQKLKIQLEEKEFAYRMNKIFFVKRLSIIGVG